MAERQGKCVNSVRFHVLWLQNHYSDCGHDIKRHLLLGRIAMSNLDSVLKSRDFTLPTKVHIYSQSYDSSSSHVWMWELDHKESWEPNNWYFDLWCWRRFLRVPWTARRSNQSILKEIILNIHWKDWCWSWNCNTLDNWCEELTHLKRPQGWERYWGGEEKGMTEDDVLGWHHWLNGREFE